MALQQPDLGVIVIATGAHPRLVAAVRSLLSEPAPLEVIVVNSGGGDAKALLARSGLRVPVVESERLLLPGAARNLGIANLRAGYIAFLADDCQATPGWAAGRLALHRAGHPAVGSALLTDRRRNPIAWAAHLYLHYRRLPGTPPHAQLVYGASYDRRLFDRHGLFREDLRIGEDTEFHSRLLEAEKPVWAPTVRTIHRTPGGIGDLVRDHFKRGRLFVRWQRELTGLARPGRRVVLRLLSASVMRFARGFQWSDGRDRFWIVLAAPFILLGAAAYSAGVLTGDRGDDRPKRTARREEQAAAPLGP